ncbi:hypothetical protein F1880_008934 [Penicillium rolfsii]|nr:hypothetical protein F1880_008934 [Penicillium rolfsii]
MTTQQFDNNRGNVQVQGTVEHATFIQNVGVSDQDRQSINRCLDYLAETDPRNTKTGIHQTRGDALKQSYDWILQHPQFQRWRESDDSQVLWIKGDPGKGKTMLLCGIIDELRPTIKQADPQAKTLLSFFFCQATVPKLSNAHAVLRGLIYMLVDTQPSLLCHVRKYFKESGDPRFVEAEAWGALCNMFVDIAGDSSANTMTAELESLQDDDVLLKYVQETLQKKAEETFLWVALVVQELEEVDSWKVRQVVNDVPTGLDDLYARMIDQMKRLASEEMEHCRLILSATALAYRPLQLLELGVVSGLPDEIGRNTKHIETMIRRSGSFLTVRDETIYFVHQSAKDYLIEKADRSIFLSDSLATHARMFTQSLQAMIEVLRRDMYGLGALGTPVNQAQPPEPDPLAAVRYSCVYWVDHLEQSGSYEELQDGSAVEAFLRSRCLYWIEALSLLRSITAGIISIQKLGNLLRGRSGAAKLQDLVQDAYRFIRYHRGAIENSPLQAYGSGLVFSPARSTIKQLFQQEWPNNIAKAPVMGDDWDAHTGACLRTLEGHDDFVTSMVFSHDSSRVASGSDDKTIRIWDVHTGACLMMLEGHDNRITSVVFSHDSSRIASGSYDKTIKIWDEPFGACLQTLEGHDNWVTSVVFSHDSSSVASGSVDKTIKIWDAHTGACLQTLEGHDNWVTSVVFSHDSCRVASGSVDKTIKIWDTHTGACLKTLEGHNMAVTSVVFFHDSRVASGSWDKTIKIWNTHTGACLQTLGVGSTVRNLSFDATGSSLLTDIGIVALHDSPTSAPTTPTKVTAPGLQLHTVFPPPQTPEYQGYGISSDLFWITRNSQNWLWLPPMYRPIFSAVGQSGVSLVLGCQSGRVLIFGFAA